ncbi:T9SS type A sorting domain-containing protein [candidate division WOR-3 bacterium]|nr:T9SS type A sorting domain-containing protein [candidate division WOR-3 bacterium]
MKKLIVLSTVFALVAGNALARRWVPFEPGASEHAAEFRVLSSNSQRTIVEFDARGLYVEDVRENGRTFQKLDFGMSGGGALTEIGAPQLPVAARFIAIPDDKAVKVSVLEADEAMLPGYSVYPAQAPQPEDRPSPAFVIDEKRYATDELFPLENARASEPMIMRDFRLVQLVVQPVRYNPVSGELRVARRLVVELRSDGYSNVNVKTRQRRHISRSFEPLYRDFIANYESARPLKAAEDGSYLIITNDDFAGAVAPFAAWKQRKGWRTKVVTTTEVGGNDTAHIDAYIADAYNNWPNPPDYVLLVGDAPDYLRCCHWPGESDASDLKYSLQEGDDLLADLTIARVSVRTPAEAQAVLNKLYKYECDPYMEDTSWFGKACAVAGYEGGTRFWTVVVRIRNYAMGQPLVQFDTLFERWDLNTAEGLTDSLNLGRSWMLYRGHGAVAAWANVEPSWTNSSVDALDNGRMVPAVVGPTCLSGNFDETEDCHAEAWLKAGEEKGGCAYFGASEVSYSGYNDSLAAGTFMSYIDSLHYTFAQCTQWGKLFMLQAYPLPNNISEEELYMFNTFGDPELGVWSAVPRQLDVTHPPTVLVGTYPFNVTVKADDDPVEGALVCVMSEVDTTIYHVGHTNTAGQVQFTLNATLPGDTVLVTVTGRNLKPYLGSAITIAPNTAYVMHLRHTIVDSAPGGNGDSIINPGEDVKLPVWVKNWGSQPASTVMGKLRTQDANVTITDSVRSFGTIPAGDSAFTGENGFLFSVAGACTNAYTFRFDLECRDANDSAWLSGINLSVGAPVLAYAGQTANDSPPGGNGDSRIDPGEIAELVVTLHNSGLGHGYNVSATLRSGDSRFAVPDSVAGFGTIPLDSFGANGADPFVVSADITIPREYAVPCTLLVTADGGYSKTIPFSVVVGEMRATDPIPDGPRTPVLYWAYDDTDTLYDQCPTYDWVEVNDVGTRLTFAHNDAVVAINIPAGFGPLVYYGQTYSHLSVSADGWIACGNYTQGDYDNTALPSNSAPPAAICANWDDLYPVSGGGGAGYVYYYHDTANHRLIVEYDSVRYYSGSIRDKFEFVFYDTTLAAVDGNNPILVQYMTANQTTSSTVGLQDGSRAIGIQCLFNGSYHRGASPLVPEHAILYTTDAATGVSEPRTDAGTAVTKLSVAVAPNPSRRAARIAWQLPKPGPVRLRVYDAGGRCVRTLVNEAMPAGRHLSAWDGKDDLGRTVANGLYLYRLQTDGRSLTTKAVLLR